MDAARDLGRRLMPQNLHELAQVWQCLQRLDHADDALNVSGLEALPSTRSNFTEVLVATHWVGYGAAVMTALFAEFPPIAQAYAGDGPSVWDTRRNVWVGLDPHLG
jgi:hypothetical protein